ncbi:hypothetical protein HYPSUDRAFT_205962 [Hypholoma sublateritium FD-334 SS-4]|uniref:Fungal-type protein kinase domain-containing protein n=1 Tax=Hypholoma sublateritium (strain FD-334 SS-4) TaxID=945553 RepID=A0A0D2NFJ8_HYPSF|nr:hypothetical protein HYPSUDRAFT_205962 [Hypholoma sublateritium FD-334 SS-4]
MNKNPITIEVAEEIFQPYTTAIEKNSLQNYIADNLNGLSVRNFVQSVWGIDPDHAQEILNHAPNISADSTTEYRQAIASKQTPNPSDLHHAFRQISSELLKQIGTTLSLDHHALDTMLWQGPGVVALRSAPPEPPANTTSDRSELRSTGITIDGLRASLWYCDRSVGWRSNVSDFGIPEGAANLGLALFALSRYNMHQYQPSEKRQSLDTIISKHGFLVRKPVTISGVTDAVPTKNMSCKTIRVIANDRYKNIWKATSTDEFKRAFLDCMRAHYYAWNARKLHHEIDEHDFMIFQPATDATTDCTGDHKPISASSFGVFVDIDTVVPAISPEDNIQLGVSDPHHRILSPLRFVAMDILHDDICLRKAAKNNSSPPSSNSELEKTSSHLMTPRFHLYRYDLESFYYVLVWACTHYDLRRNSRLKSRSYRLSLWASPLVDNVRMAKRRSCPSRIWELEDRMLYEWESVWRNWVTPLVSMFATGLRGVEHSYCQDQTGVDFDTGGGRITFKKFMEAIGEDLPDDSAPDKA